MKSCASAVLLLVVFLAAISSASAVVYVKWDSPGPVFDGNSWATAYHTIQQGVNDADLADEEVRVARGTYGEAVYLFAGRTLKGGYSGVADIRDIRANPTIIHSPDRNMTVVLAYGGNMIDGFTIRNGECGVDCYTGSMTVSNNVIEDNGYFGIRCDSSSARIISNIITGNCISGIITARASVSIVGNTIAANEIGVILVSGGSVEFENNIIAHNHAVGIDDWGPSQPTAITRMKRNCVFGSGIVDYNVTKPSGTTDISADPLFVSREFGDFHIAPNSPCRDSGDNSYTSASEADIDGQGRIIASSVDMGADESYGETYPSPYPARVVYVNAAATGGDGTSWANAFKTIEGAMNDAAANGGGEVWIAKGTYPEKVQLRSFVWVYGGFGGTESAKTQRDFHNNKVTVTNSGDQSVTGAGYCGIDHVTISGGQYGVYAYFGYTGISNCVIMGTQQAMSLVEFTGVLTGNVIANNANGIYFHYAGRATLLTNNTIAMNTGYGIYCDYANPDMANNIIAFNDKGVQWLGPDSTWIPIMQNNDVYGNNMNYDGFTGGTSDIHLAPLFVDSLSGDFHIMGNSRCRDAGRNNAKGIPSLDFDGQARIEGPTVDIGADESYSSFRPGVYCVKPDSPFNGPGYDWEHAYHTISGAFASANVSGDTVLVAQGTYAERIAIPAGVTLRGGHTGQENGRSFDPGLTVIDGGGSGTTVTLGLNTTIESFAIKGGSTGVSCAYTSSKVLGNIITDNTQYGVYCNGGAPSVINNVIKQSGTGVYIIWSDVKLQNNTIISNATRGVNVSSGSVVIANNIIASNGYGIYNPGKVGQTSHNDVFGNTTQYFPSSLPHATDITLDPLFANSATGDYHLRLASPCLDTGDALGAPATDMDGNPRPFDGNGDGATGVDMGCYEFTTNYTSIAMAKSLPDGSPVGLVGVVSTAVFGDRFYVGGPNLLCGIGVLGNIGSPGKRKTVTGVMGTVDGERVIGSGQAIGEDDAQMPSPFMMNSNAIGGGPCGLQVGVSDWRLDEIGGIWQRSPNPTAGGGANNIGLLLKTTGRVVSGGEGFFFLGGACVFDDGSTLDTSGKYVKGVHVDWPFTEAKPEPGTFVEITGISSCTIKNGVVVRMLRPVAAGAVRQLSP